MTRQLINHILAGTAQVLHHTRAEMVLEALYARTQRAADESRDDPEALGDFGYSLRPGQGELRYLLCRTTGARRVVDFSTSEGATAIYLAAAIRDNGGGSVVSADPRPDKIHAARANLEAAGLIEYVDLRGGSPPRYWRTSKDLSISSPSTAGPNWPRRPGPSGHSRSSSPIFGRGRSS